jgi:hypothetical protein
MGETNSPSVVHVSYDISPLLRVKLKILPTRLTACGKLKILPTRRITDFSTTGSAGLKLRNNGRKCYYHSLFCFDIK